MTSTTPKTRKEKKTISHLCELQDHAPQRQQPDRVCTQRERPAPGQGGDGEAGEAVMVLGVGRREKREALILRERWFSFFIDGASRLFCYSRELLALPSHTSTLQQRNDIAHRFRAQ